MSLYLICESESEKLIAMSAKFAAGPASDVQNALMDATPMQIHSNVAQIEIAGILEPNRVALYDYWGVKHTAYSDIESQTAQAIEDGAKSIQYNIRSGGGNVEGMLPAMKTIKKAGIPTKASVSGLCASAAYMLASQCDSIEASSEIDILGSIGVVTSRFSYPFFKEITNSASPNKRPDVATEEGLSAVREVLDDIYGVVMPYVVKSRNTSIEKINSEWGKGGTMTAKTALSRGMIDMINERVKTAGRSGANKGKNMDMATLKAEHPDLYNAAFDAGKEAGKAEFKELAEAHLELAEASGAMERAIEDIKAGNAVGPKVFAFHNAEGIRRAQVKARDEEAPEEISEGKDAQASANEGSEEKDDALVGEAKSFYDGKVIYV
jgi:ClpP class serine protease